MLNKIIPFMCYLKHCVYYYEHYNSHIDIHLSNTNKWCKSAYYFKIEELVDAYKSITGCMHVRNKYFRNRCKFELITRVIQN